MDEKRWYLRGRVIHNQWRNSDREKNLPEVEAEAWSSDIVIYGKPLISMGSRGGPQCLPANGWQTVSQNFNGERSSRCGVTLYSAGKVLEGKRMLDQALRMVEKLYGKDDVRIHEQIVVQLCENCLRVHDRTQNGNQGTWWCSMPFLFRTPLSWSYGRWSAMLSLFSCCLQWKRSATFVSVPRNPGGANGGF